MKWKSHNFDIQPRNRLYHDEGSLLRSLLLLDADGADDAEDDEEDDGKGNGAHDEGDQVLLGQEAGIAVFDALFRNVHDSPILIALEGKHIFFEHLLNWCYSRGLLM